MPITHPMTPERQDKAIIDELNALIELDFDAVKAYEAAIERLNDVECKRFLTEFKADHERHIRDLQAMVQQLGATPKEKGDFKQILTKGRVLLRGMQGDEAIMRAMRSNEDDTNRRYEKALKNVDFGGRPDVRQLVEKNLEDERRHRAWIVSWLERV